MVSMKIHRLVGLAIPVHIFTSLFEELFVLFKYDSKALSGRNDVTVFQKSLK